MLNHEWPLQSADQNKVEGLFVLQLKRPLKQEENNKSKTNSDHIVFKVIQLCLIYIKSPLKMVKKRYLFRENFY